MLFGCFGKRRKKRPPITIVRSPSPDCRCSCHGVRRASNQVIAPCEPPDNNELQSHEGSKHLSRRSHSPGSRSLERPKSPKAVSIQKQQSRPPSFTMDLTYITERIIAISFPETGNNTAYRNNLKDVTRMLRQKHGNKYMVFNLSEKRYDLAKLNPQVLDFGWPPHLAPPLERLCSLCKSLESWLNSDPSHVAVLHSKGDKGRTGVVIAAYMHYTSICASADQALDRLAMKRFYDDKLSNSMHPSQQRYVQYFAGLLSSAIKMNNNPLYLHHIVIHGVPNFETKGGCRPFVKVYQGMQPVYTSGVYTVGERARRIIIGIEPSLQLRGDILIKCYHKRQRPPGRFPLFRLQFHTCTLEKEKTVFQKDQLDDAISDPRFPEDCRVELQFSSKPDDYKGNGSAHDALLPIDSSQEPLVKWNSYENFDSIPEDSLDGLDSLLEGERVPVPHTTGPLDGSLYATVNKKATLTGTGHRSGQPPLVSTNGLEDQDGPHTISMDSGISSASGAPGVSQINGHHRHSPPALTGSCLGTGIIGNGSSGLPSPNTITEVEVHPRPSSSSPVVSDLRAEHAQLDELLDGMLREIQSIPDPPAGGYRNPTLPRRASLTNKFGTMNGSMTGAGPSGYLPSTGVISVNGTRQTVLPATLNSYPRPSWMTDSSLTEEDEKSKPFHARKTSAPFSYGIAPNSPALQRRRFLSDSAAPVFGGLSRRYEQDLLRDMSSSPEPFRPDETSLTWLQRQQQKLQARREGRGWENRHNMEQQLIEELRQSTQHTRNPYLVHHEIAPIDFNTDFSSSSRENSPSKITPLHVHTTYNGSSTLPPALGSSSCSTATPSKPPMCRGSSAPSSPIIPSRSSSRDITRSRFQQWQIQTKPLVRQKSDTSYDRERPFMAVKRAHENARDQMLVNGTSPHNVVAYGTVYPYGQPHPSAHDHNDPAGLLALLEDHQPVLQDPTRSCPSSSRLDELEQSLHALNTYTSPKPVPPMFQSTPIKGSSSVDTAPPAWHTPSFSRISPTGSPLLEDRPNTPAFPVAPCTPYANNQDPPTPTSGLPPKSPTLSRQAYRQRFSAPSFYSNYSYGPLYRCSSVTTLPSSKDRSPSPATLQALRQGLAGQSLDQNTSSGPFSTNGQSSPSVYFGQSRRSSMLSLSEPGEVISHHPLFVKDTSKYWYKPDISREDAIHILKDKAPGTFIVRDSNSFPGAYGLALKVATPPPNIQNKSGDLSNELVRHFLIEPTSKGVRLKGCANEPIFGSLSALVYQHSLTQLALPCKLQLPEYDLSEGLQVDGGNTTAAVLEQGAACNVLYLTTVDTESLTGPQAVRRALNMILEPHRTLPEPTPVHFKASSQGVILTDNNRKLFFRRHYPVNTISHCGLDPDNRKWTQKNEAGVPIAASRCFGFVARKPTSKTDNQCHIFAELDPDQPASAIVGFVTKVLLSGPQNGKSNLV